jgi:hypothetical protein
MWQGLGGCLANRAPNSATAWQYHKFFFFRYLRTQGGLKAAPRYERLGGFYVHSGATEHILRHRI